MGGDFGFWDLQYSMRRVAPMSRRYAGSGTLGVVEKIFGTGATVGGFGN